MAIVKDKIFLGDASANFGRVYEEVYITEDNGKNASTAIRASDVPIKEIETFYIAEETNPSGGYSAGDILRRVKKYRCIKTMPNCPAELIFDCWYNESMQDWIDPSIVVDPSQLKKISTDYDLLEDSFKIKVFTTEITEDDASFDPGVLPNDLPDGSFVYSFIVTSDANHAGNVLLNGDPWGIGGSYNGDTFPAGVYKEGDNVFTINDVDAGTKLNFKVSVKIPIYA